MGSEASRYIDTVVDTVAHTVKETGSTVVSQTGAILDKCTAAVEESVRPQLTTAVDAMGSSSTTYERQQEGFHPDFDSSPSYFRSIEQGHYGQSWNNQSSLCRLNNALSEIKVCPKDAESTGRLLRDKYFSEWGETCAVKDFRGFQLAELETLIDKIGDVYGDKKWEIQRKLKGIKFCESLDVKVLEFAFGEDFGSGKILFGMIAISKSGLQLEAVSCSYQLNFTLAPVKVTKETKDYFLGFETGSNTSTWHEGANLGLVTQRELHNFFRYKALREFQNKNLVTRINSVSTLQYI